jgi:hypothetical protein
MSNRLLNYTTKIEAEFSYDEIRRMLRAAGAVGISEQIDRETRKTIGISFTIETAKGMQSNFVLPVRTELAYAVMERQGLLPNKAPYRRDAELQRRERVRVDALNRAQAERVSWRIVRDWLEAQIALIQVGMAELSEVMLPYLLTADGTTLYQFALSEGMLALPAPKDA